MVLVIDTSSARSALALVEDGKPAVEDIVEAGREHDLRRRVAALVDPGRLSGVAVSLGPGSFTGLRAGVSFGVGLAIGLRVALWGLDPLLLQAARSRRPATAVVEAGRGRIFWLEPGGGEPRHGEPAHLPQQIPAVGWLRSATADALREAGVQLLAEDELMSFAEASASQLQGAQQLGYGTVSLRYMESFAPLRGQSW